MAKPLGAIALAVALRSSDTLSRWSGLGGYRPQPLWRCDPSRCTRCLSCPGRQPSDWTTGPCNACLRICKHTSRLTFLSTN
jgi:hypothetical protein